MSASLQPTPEHDPPTTPPRPQGSSKVNIDEHVARELLPEREAAPHLRCSPSGNCPTTAILRGILANQESDGETRPEGTRFGMNNLPAKKEGRIVSFPAPQLDLRERGGPEEPGLGVARAVLAKQRARSPEPPARTLPRRGPKEYVG